MGDFISMSSILTHSLLAAVKIIYYHVIKLGIAPHTLSFSPSLNSGGGISIYANISFIWCEFYFGSV